MKGKVYINSIASFLPGVPVPNEEMEDYLGLIGGKPSRVKSIVLRQNGIKTRYYGLDKEHKMTYSNAQLAKEAVCGLFPDKTVPSDVSYIYIRNGTAGNDDNWYLADMFRRPNVVSQRPYPYRYNCAIISGIERDNNNIGSTSLYRVSSINHY